MDFIRDFIAHNLNKAHSTNAIIRLKILILKSEKNVKRWTLFNVCGILICVAILHKERTKLVKKKIIIQYGVLGLALLAFIVKPAGTLGETMEIEDTTEAVVGRMTEVAEPVEAVGLSLTQEAPLDESTENTVNVENTENTENVSQDTEGVPQDVENTQPQSEENEETIIIEEEAPVSEEASAPSEDEVIPIAPLEDLDEEVLDEESTAVLETIMEEQEDLSVSVIWKGQNVSQQDLRNAYQLTFSEDFAEIMSEIELEYREGFGLAEEASENVALLQATNWHDVIARYLLQRRALGESEFSLGIEDKEGLQRIYREMNRVIYIEDMQEESAQTRVLYRSVIPAEHRALLEGALRYQALTIEELIALDQSLARPIYSEEDLQFLQKYSSEEFRILCAGATRAGGFLQQPEEEVSRSRQEVLKAAFQAIGKVPYFWGGKSSAIGLDPRIGTAVVVSADGSTTTGSTRAYGLDCSGFVSWAFVNGAHYSGSPIAGVGAGTVGQWAASVGISQEEAQPGDLVFLASPQHVRGINHVGIVVGRDSAGGLLAIHCNAGDNGVVVESAYSAGFRYVRRPLVFANETMVY